MIDVRLEIRPRSEWRAVVALLLLLAFTACKREPEAPDVLLLTVDTLRADRLGAYGYGPARTHRLDALAASGRTFLLYAVAGEAGIALACGHR